MRKAITRLLATGVAAPALALGPAAIALADTHFDAAGSGAGPHGAGQFCTSSSASPGYYPRSGCGGGGGGGGRPHPDTRPVINIHIHNHLDVDNTNINDLDNTQELTQEQIGSGGTGHEITEQQIRG
ncbi:hypothetical protein ACIBFB_11385 [Nocardiopsis sp. NPDC050513]|uniref:hypothetical protein n=1 Tax=Nocardiopsis sp. NPDC050513 TaxID=3364338 RepID=UPI003797711E